MACVPSRSRRRGHRSATTPPISVNKRIGTKRNRFRSPSATAEPGDLVDKPVQRHLVHPVARLRDERACPEQTIVAVLEDEKVSLNDRALRLGTDPSDSTT